MNDLYADQAKQVDIRVVPSLIRWAGELSDSHITPGHAQCWRTPPLGTA